MKNAFLSMAAATLLVVAGSANAVVLTMDELPLQPVDGLSFSGVTFSFTVGGSPSTDANYNSSGPGIGTFVQDPSIEGNAAGILGLDFATPVASLSFGVALSTGSPLFPGFSVALFDATLASLGVFSVNTLPLIIFSEGQFTFSGVPVLRAVLDFVDFEAPQERFAFDNLAFTAASVPEPGGRVPEPGTLLLLASALAALGFMRRSRAGRH